VEDLRERTIRSIYYQGVLTVATAVAGAVSVLVLARTLSPEDYGRAMFAFIIVTAVELVSDFGIMSAVLSQRDDLGVSVDAAATLRFLLSVISSGALALFAIAFSGPLGYTGFSEFLFYLSFVPLVSGLGFASQVKLRLSLDFRHLSMAQAGGMVGSPVAQATLAILGAGPFSIVAGVVFGHVLQFALLFLVRPVLWHPTVDVEGWRRLLGFGGQVIGTGLLTSAFDLSAATLVSLYAGPVALGGYLLAVRLAMLVPLRALSIVIEVLLPTLSKIREEGGNVNHPYIEGVRAVALPTLFVNMAAVALAAPGVLLVGGARWESAVLDVRLMAIYGILYALAGVATPYVQMRGSPGASLRQAAVTLSLLWILGPPVAAFLGLSAFLLVLVGLGVFTWLYVAAIVHRLGGPRAPEVARAFAPAALVCAVAAAVAVALLFVIPLEPFGALLAGTAVYVAVAVAFDRIVYGGRNLAQVRHFVGVALRRRSGGDSDG